MFPSHILLLTLKVETLGLHANNVLGRNSDAEIKKFLRKLNEIDFSSIASTAIEAKDGEVLTIAQVTNAIEQYRHFLVLNFLYPKRSLIPTQIVDLIWHIHLLDTQKYQQDCMEVFGYFLHHFPHAGKIDEVDKQASELAFADTCQLLEHHFG
jgi:hypothetical protein